MIPGEVQRDEEDREDERDADDDQELEDEVVVVRCAWKNVRRPSGTNRHQLDDVGQDSKPT